VGKREQVEEEVEGRGGAVTYALAQICENFFNAKGAKKLQRRKE